MSEHRWYTAERVVDPSGYKILVGDPGGVDGAREREIADTYEPTEGPDAGRIARLIAAAPELLEALQKIAGGHGIPDETLATGGLYGWAQGVAREAVAKVEGRDK